MSSIFKFKAFQVDQEGCAMKINTDGVLLGAVAQHAKPTRVLDVGTGTGVIALMLAQRYPEAFVDAIEIDPSASETAMANFSGSDFSSRLNLFPGDVTEFESDFSYDLIVSNPPYFVNDLKNPEEKKSLARHTDEGFFERMTGKVASILNEDGEFWVILPVKHAQELIMKAVLYKLFPRMIVHIFSDKGKPEIRQIVCFSFVQTSVRDKNFYIYDEEGHYTDNYVKLLKDFFLAF